MNNDIERLESKIRELTERLQRLENEVFPEAVEKTEPRAELRPVDTQKEPAATKRAVSSAPEDRVPASAIISSLGRSLVVLGGAFLLRWLTQSDVLPHRIGVVVGMVYALLWVAMADVDARRGQRLSAVFHGVTGVFIALPLLVEATTKFNYLTPILSAILLPAVIILGLFVAGRRDLRALAWGVTLPAAPLAFILSAQTQATTPFLISLLLLGFATLWLGYLRRWHGLATLMAGAANLGLALMVMEQIMMSKRVPPGPMEDLWEVLFLLFGLIALYFGSYCFRVFKRKRTITPLEIGNTLVVVLIGLGGAAMVINANDRSMVPLGIFCVALSIAN